MSSFFCVIKHYKTRRKNCIENVSDTERIDAFLKMAVEIEIGNT